MSTNAIEKAVRSAIEPTITTAGLFLESLQISTAGKNRMIRVLVDGPKSLSLDEVTAITKPISERLDAVVELGERPFTLEVSSPGVDFPLSLPRHWQKNVGRLVSITDVAGAKISGRISSVTETEVILEMAKGEVRHFDIKSVKEALIQIEFK